MTLKGDMKRRPLRITLIGVLSIFAGLIFLFPVLGSFGIANLVDISGQTFNQGPLVLTAVVIAIANFILGIGCLYGWRPIWLYLTIISLINFVIAVFALMNADTGHYMTVLIPLAWLAIAVYVLISMQTQKCKAWFGR
jgi:hypothetical protein